MDENQLFENERCKRAVFDFCFYQHVWNQSRQWVLSIVEHNEYGRAVLDSQLGVDLMLVCL